MAPLRVLSPVLCLPLAFLSPAHAQDRVDLTSWQTPLKNQGNRTTCISFAAMAALEARYRRTGLTLDLSEEFAVSMEKMNWLHAAWHEIPTADARENQLIGTGGGGGCGYVFELQHWMRVPVETAMPYRSTEVVPPQPWSSSHWQSQRNTNTWNLDPANLPRAALNQANYYSVASQVQIYGADSRNPAVIEAALRNGYEVVWDFYVHPTGSTGSIWHAPSFAAAGAHSMLIVGYDRRSTNPANHHFIVKNSWGATTNPGGYTHIGYDYLRSQGYQGAYITAVRTPGPWHELKFLGRRNLCFDGWRGTLDVYHLPNSFEEAWLEFRGLTMTDQRVGTFYDAAGTAHRVNGYIVGNELTFWFKGSNPNMRWDEQRETPTLGRMFKLRIVDGDGDELAGVHWDNAGGTPNPAFGGYARRPTTMNGSNGFLSPVFHTSQASAPAQWLGRWRLQAVDHTADLVVARRNDLLVPSHQVNTHAGLECFLREGNGAWQSCTAVTELTNSRTFALSFPPAFLTGSMSALMLTWQRGVAAGYASHSGLTRQAGYMVRLGEHAFGSSTSYGTGCGPSNAVPVHGVVGTPELGQTLQFRVTQATSSSPAILMMGLSRTTYNGQSLPFSLANLGAPGCWIRAQPLSTTFGIAGSTGVLSFGQVFNAPALRGVHVYSQFLSLRPGYNSLGVVLSNGCDTLLGASY